MLDTDRHEAMRKMREIVSITESLPGIDCGSCGAPNCRALAEDIVRGKASPDDCVFLMRDKLRRMLDEGATNYQSCPNMKRNPPKEGEEA